MKTAYLHVIGFGNVGRQVIRHILDNENMHKETLQLSIRILSLSDTSATLINHHNHNHNHTHTHNHNHEYYFSREMLEELLEQKSKGTNFKDFKDSKGSISIFTGGLNSLLNETNRNAQEDHHDGDNKKVIVADCSASDTSYETLLNALDLGFGVVLANKKPLVTPLHVYNKFMKNWRRNLRWESTVGAGCPIIAAQMRLIGAGDTIHKMVGTFSGTLGFVMTGLENSKPFSSIVKEAHSLGYTEPDPRDDLGGVDVARKALILARAIGWKLEMADVSVEPLYPPSMAKLSVPDFMSSLSQLDEEFANKVANAAKDGKVLRYAANIENGKCKVAPILVEKKSPLGTLSGTNNMIEFHTKWYSSSPLVIQGSGAGGDQTAAGVLADIVELAYSL